MFGVAIRYWKRMRDEAAKHADDSRPDDDNPWDEARPTLSQLHSTYAIPEDNEQATRYSEWAERMHTKRQRLRDAQAGEPKASYWTTDAVFEESRRIDDEELHDRPNPWRVKELLAVLDLRENASPDDVSTAYRTLAKKHHPDRFIEADEDTQEFHAERMRSINAAYHSLRTLERA